MGVYDNNFLQDYSGVNAAGSAVQGFLKGMNDMDDRKMKQQEFQAKMAAMQTQTQRDALNQKIELYQKNLTQGDDGSISSTPLRPEQVTAQNIGLKEKGVASTPSAEPGGQPTLSYDHDSPQWIAAHAKEYGAEHRSDEKPVKSAEWQKFADALNPNKARGGNLAKTQAMINSTDRIDALFKQFPDGNIPKTQSVELGTAVAGLISGGSPQSQQQIHDIVPSSVLGNVADLGSWYTGNPTGREQQEFMRLLQDTSGRERDVAVRQKLEAQRAVLPAFEHLRSGHPGSDEARYLRQLKAMGVTEFDDPQAAPPAAPPQATQNPGLVKQGFLSKLGGLLMGSPADAGKPALPPPHPKDEAAVRAANRILTDKNSTPAQKKQAQEALSLNGM